MEEKKSFGKKLGTFFSVILLLILIPYLILSIILTYSKITKMNEVAGIFGFKPITVRNNDMGKSMKKGDLLIVKGVEEDPTVISSGDIVAFLRDNDKNPSIRRIVRTLKPATLGKEGSIGDIGEYNTKADGKKKEDKKRLFSDEIVGEALIVVPYLGTFLSYIENTWLLVFSLPILITIIILLFILFNKCSIKKKKDINEKPHDSSELFTAAELTSGQSIRENLLNSKLQNKNITGKESTETTPKPGEQKTVSVTNTPPVTSNLGSGIQVVPPIEVQKQESSSSTNANVQPKTNDPVVIPLPSTPKTNSNQNVVVVPQNNNGNKN